MASDFILSTFYLLLLFAPLAFLERWIHRHLHGVALLIAGHDQAALYLYGVLLFPGVALHEFSHWLTARLLGVRVGRLRLLPVRGRDGRVQLGSLQVQQVDIIRASLIGAAPLVSGCLVVLAIGYRVFGIGALPLGDWAMMTAAVISALQTPDMWVWLYLLFAVANAMLPSSADRQAWPPVIIFLLVTAAVVYIVGGRAFVSDVTPVLTTALRWLTVAFAITLIVDIPFVALIGLAEWGIGALRGQRVEYRGGR